MNSKTLCENPACDEALREIDGAITDLGTSP